MFNSNGLQEVFDLFGQLAKAIYQLRRERFDLTPINQVSNSAIKAQAQIEVGDIGLRNQDRGAQGDLRRPGLAWRRIRRHTASPGGGDGLFEHLLIELDPHLANVAGLFLTQEITGATDIQIVARQGEAGTQGVQRLHYL